MTLYLVSFFFLMKTRLS